MMEFYTTSSLCSLLTNNQITLFPASKEKKICFLNIFSVLKTLFVLLFFYNKTINVTINVIKSLLKKKHITPHKNNCNKRIINNLSLLVVFRETS